MGRYALSEKIVRDRRVKLRLLVANFEPPFLRMRLEDDSRGKQTGGRFEVIAELGAQLHRAVARQALPAARHGLGAFERDHIGVAAVGGENQRVALQSRLDPGGERRKAQKQGGLEAAFKVVEDYVVVAPQGRKADRTQALARMRVALLRDLPLGVGTITIPLSIGGPATPVTPNLIAPQGNAPTTTGFTHTYLEDYLANSQMIVQGQVVSLITEGVFDRIPSLRVCLAECGFSWLPPLLKQLDTTLAGVRERGAIGRIADRSDQGRGAPVSDRERAALPFARRVDSARARDIAQESVRSLAAAAVVLG